MIKKKHQYHDCDDIDHYGIRDIEDLFDNDDYNYYKPILIKSSFKDNYKHESRRDQDKKLSVKQYLYKIMPYLRDIVLFQLKIQEKLVLFLCGVIMSKLGRVMKQMTLLKIFLILS